ncbi:DUF6221 family protein [Streptomyces collinus]|uniref:DUF6221 family protein n=1 Tax=Streptomyces collinus TaxID=42684 RepID=UPI0037F68556
MTAQGEDLLAWLHGAITRAEESARSAAVDPIGRMSRSFAGDAETLRRDIASGRSAQDGRLEYDKGQADALHWASVVLPERMKPLSLHDPASVLRRCAADRKLIAAHPVTRDVITVQPDGTHGFGCAVCHHEDLLTVGDGWCDTLLALAEGYGWTGGER